MNGINTLTLQMQQAARLRLLQMHYNSGVGHIGGNLSSLDILLALFHNTLKASDVFVLSKGHSAGALYVSLWSIGRISDTQLEQFHKDNTKLSGHPPATGIPEVLFATGSLGHGLSLAAGLALGKRLKQEQGHVYCVMSDGEWNEGSCWEALIFAAHQKLSNLTFIVDKNNLQGFGTTQEVANLEPLAAKFRAFDVETRSVDGHNLQELSQALQSKGYGPQSIIANTIKGRGVSFMEGKMEWHYLPLNETQYLRAVRENSEV